MRNLFFGICLFGTLTGATFKGKKVENLQYLGLRNFYYTTSAPQAKEIDYVFYKDHSIYYDVDRDVYLHLLGDKFSVSFREPLYVSKEELKASSQIKLSVVTMHPERYFYLLRAIRDRY